MPAFHQKLEVLEPDYIPEVLPHRSRQIDMLVSAVKPALHGLRPTNCLCMGPPATGKTSVIKHMVKGLESWGESRKITVSHINCLAVSSKQQIFSRIFRSVCGYSPPSRGLSFSSLFISLIEGLNGTPLIVILDDVDALDNTTLNEVLLSLLKAHEEETIKVGVICVSTDPKILSRLYPSTGSVFHPYEVYFSPYTREEMSDILWDRVEIAFNGRFDGDAFNLVVDESYRAGDLRYGIAILKLAGYQASARKANKIETEDVLDVIERARFAFVEKILASLSRDERILLSIIYGSHGYSITTLYKKFRERTDSSYSTFIETIHKFHRLRLIDCRVRDQRKMVMGTYSHETIIDMIQTKITA